VGKEQQGRNCHLLYNSSKNKGSGQLMDEPFFRAFAVDSSTLRCSRAGRCQIRFVGAPFYGVSACDFHRNRNALKGTPTAQPFDNRSIA